MHTRIPILAALVALGTPLADPADPPMTGVILRSSIFSPGVPLPEAKRPVYAVGLDVQANAKGEGKGTLMLTVTPPNYDEYGDLVTGTEVDRVERKPRGEELPMVKLECRLKLEKVGFVGRVNTPPVQRALYAIEGPKIGSKLYFATTGSGLTSGRLLILGKDDRVEHVVELSELKPRRADEEVLPVPCHPGCFPAGTLIRIPDGTKRIELIRAGDVVTTVGADGRAAQSKVETVFTSKNRLVEVRTDHGTAVTTEAQPLCLIAGGFRKAGDLKAGDRIWQWRDGRRAEAVIREVAATGRVETVYNLIVGDSVIFVAGDFLARGKPPADSAAATPEKSITHAGHGK
ncbi:MAG TPA: Hint domain-containing protein [Gemmataceae bacterium]|jgi:hypothetical protein|nr:Hint domain-containing protein [Gemmataceae bacterium]